MQRTEAQRSASRGPVTPEGRARSSQNATTHGLFSTALLLKKESREAWILLSHAAHPPQTAEAYCKAVGRDKAVLERGRPSIRLNHLRMRLYKQMKELRKDRQPVSGPPSEPERKSEPEKPPAPAPQQYPAQSRLESTPVDSRSCAAKEAKGPCTGQ